MKSTSTTSQAPAVFDSVDLCAVSGPCGHEVPLEAAWVARDRFTCPTCGMCWGVIQEAPTVYPSGFVMPGKRTVVIEDQANLPMALPHPDDVAARKKLAEKRPASLDVVMTQIRASQSTLALPST